MRLETMTKTNGRLNGMKKDAEELMTKLRGKYRVRESFLGEIRPLLDKIYSGTFTQAKQTALIALAEDAFRREQEIFDQQAAASQSFEKMCADLEHHYQQFTNIHKLLTDAMSQLGAQSGQSRKRWIGWASSN